MRTIMIAVVALSPVLAIVTFALVLQLTAPRPAGGGAHAGAVSRATQVAATN